MSSCAKAMVRRFSGGLFMRIMCTPGLEGTAVMVRFWNVGEEDILVVFVLLVV